MTTKRDPRLTRRDVLRIGAMTGAATALGTLGARPTTAAAQAACTGLLPLEVYPTSPLILRPFTDSLPIPKALAPVDKSVVDTWANPPGYGTGQQDAFGGTHQLSPSQLPAPYNRDPLVYRIKLETAAHSFSSSPVRTLVTYRDRRGNLVPAGAIAPKLPDSTIYGFNGTFPGPMINAEYGRPVIVRFENHLDENPLNLDRGDFGDPGLGFLTHLHNGHTAAESDGNPHHRHEAYNPGEWFDACYLNYPAGGLDSEKQGLLWFHDHREGHTGANVYKGMVGLFPVYDGLTGSKLDPGDETKGLRLPGVRKNRSDGAFDVEYDVPLALYDCAFDDGATAHQDWHNGCGEFRPDQWGKSFFRHYPDHGFVGDVFTVNGKAYPVMQVKRRKYRFRVLPASIARCWELSLMSSRSGPKAAVSLGYSAFDAAGLPTGDLQGQYRIPDGQRCMKMTMIATGGGLLPRPLVKNSFECWPAMRHEVVVDFTKYEDGTPTKKGDVIYLTNIMKMVNGRKPTASTRLGLDPAYKVPLLKFVIEDDADAEDNSLIPAQLRPQSPIPTNWRDLPRRRFTLSRNGGFGTESQWLINDNPFDVHTPLAEVRRGAEEVWILENGGGGWTHPMHIHQEEHRVLLRGTGNDLEDLAPPEGQPGHDVDSGKDDVIALDPGESVAVFRRFRTFVGNYVAHCHNLAHEDHSMMFGWKIVP
jgi:FtsP/CotA-like multicopper oxidase with cupredoxin domain